MRLIHDGARLGSRVSLAVAVLAGCDSTSPPITPLLRIQGEVLQAGQPPTPPLDLDIQAWFGSDGSDSAALRTDPAGGYGAELGPFPDFHLDSLLVRVHQYDCGRQITTELRRPSLTLDGSDTLVMPTVALSYRLLPAQFGIGGAVCGAIVTRTTSEFIGDYASLALWFDELSDSVRGRWRLNHQASSADDYGYFSGTREADGLTLLLRPTQPTACVGLQVEIPIPPNTVNMEPASVTDLPGGTCFIPSTTLRFFDGAELPEVLPPLSTVRGNQRG